MASFHYLPWYGEGKSCHLSPIYPPFSIQFSEARQKGFLTVMDLKERGIPLVGTYCTFMPQEIPMAAGAVVVSLCSTSDETIEEAEKDLPRNLCPLIKSSYGFGKTDKCPYFYFSDLVVGGKPPATAKENV